MRTAFFPSSSKRAIGTWRKMELFRQVLSHVSRTGRSSRGDLQGAEGRRILEMVTLLSREIERPRWPDEEGPVF